MTGLLVTLLLRQVFQRSLPLELVVTSPLGEVRAMLAIVQLALGIEFVEVSRAKPVALLELAQGLIGDSQVIQDIAESNGRHFTHLVG
jgi:hypothetical protein